MAKSVLRKPLDSLTLREWICGLRVLLAMWCAFFIVDWCRST